MEHNLQHTISLLTRTPATLNALLRDLPETWTLRNEGENTWSAFDVVGHLILGAELYLGVIARGLQGDTSPFLG